VIRELHDNSGGHRGIEGTYQTFRKRYFWPNLYKEVRLFAETCEECQRQSEKKENEELYPSWTTSPWMKAGFDIVHMSKGLNGLQYIVTIRDNIN
ncbi:hypothetical protein BKA69DRAFT_1016375, partial [Paraphysoderma sedebokerense]